MHLLCYYYQLASAQAATGHKLDYGANRLGTATLCK